MTNTTREQIVKNIKMLPNIGYGAYRPIEMIRVAIAKAIGYETRRMIGGSYVIIGDEPAYKNVNQMLHELVTDGTLIKSKRGTMLKLK